MELYNPSHFEVLLEGEGPEATESQTCHTSKEAEKYAWSDGPRTGPGRGHESWSMSDLLYSLFSFWYRIDRVV